MARPPTKVSPVQKGESDSAGFADDYPEKELPAGDPSLKNSIRMSMSSSLLSLKGMKPMPMSRQKFSTMFPAMLIHLLRRAPPRQETSGAIFICQKLFILLILNRILEDKNIQRVLGLDLKVA